MNNKPLILMILSMIFSMIMWGVNWPASKLLTTYTTVPVLIFWRYIFAAAFVSLFYVRFSPSPSFSRSTRKVLATCIFFQLAYQFFFFIGLKIGLASIAGVLVPTVSPVLTFILSSLFNKKRLTRREIIFLTIGLIGSFVFLQLWVQPFTFFNLWDKGIILFFLAALSWACLSVASEKQPLDGLTFNMTLFVSMIICSGIFIALQGIPIDLIFPTSLSFWALMTFTGILGTGVATGLFFLVNFEKGAKFTTAFMFLVPVSAVCVSVIFLNETITLTQLVGASMMVLAAYGLNRKQKKTVE